MNVQASLIASGIHRISGPDREGEVREYEQFYLELPWRLERAKIEYKETGTAMD